MPSHIGVNGPGLALRPRGAVWFLSFDCATETFAFSLSMVDIATYISTRDSMKQRIQAVTMLLERAQQSPQLAIAAAAAVEKLDTESRFIRLVDGETASLCPGVKDKDIPTVTRIKSLVRYTNTRILPSLRRNISPGVQVRVLIEYQMGDAQRKISDALIAIFADYDVFIVGPSHKNRIYTCEEGKYSKFAPKYANAYNANKAHAKFNFEKIEKTFGSCIPASSNKLRGHIADSFMQVLGHITCSDSDEEARARY